MRLGLIHMRTASSDKGSFVAPNGIGYLASYVEKYHGIENSFMAVHPDKLIAGKPDIVGISTVSETYPAAREVARAIKAVNPKIKVIIGGPHITALPEALDPNMDAGVISEGEQQFGELIDLIRNNDWSPDKLKNIAGIIYRDAGNNIINTGKRPWLKDIDIIPPPKRAGIAGIYVRPGEVPFQQSLMTERGCPFKCEYCSAVSFWENVRTHSLERVQAELEDLIRNYPEQKIITISDDLFGLNKKRLRSMVDMIKSEGYHKKVGFICQTRASCFSEEACAMMAEMNMKVICFGFESANDRVLKFLKGNGKASDNQRAIDLCSKYGIGVLGNFIVGNPTETVSELSDTYWFIRRNLDELWRVHACTATPFPGTRWWDYARERNLVNDGFDDWEVLNLSFNPEKTVYMNEHISKAEFKEILPVFYETGNPKNVSADQQYEEETIYREYINDQFSNIAAMIDKTGCRVLEISGLAQGIAGYFSKATAEKVGIINGEAAALPPGQAYDYIFLPYSLERMRDPAAFLTKAKSLLAENGQLLILSYNIAHLSVISDLISNNWHNTYNGIRQKKNLSFLSATGIEDILKKTGYSDIAVERIPLDISQYQKTLGLLQEYFSKVIPIEKFLKEMNTAAYFISCKNSLNRRLSGLKDFAEVV
jgi:anaerobic magnesium-protoporphyrin IX monomethyl ester cyclase